MVADRLDYHFDIPEEDRVISVQVRRLQGGGSF
jgi:hypothetical protein